MPNSLEDLRESKTYECRRNNRLDGSAYEGNKSSWNSKGVERRVEKRRATDCRDNGNRKYLYDFDDDLLFNRTADAFVSYTDSPERTRPIAD